MNIEILCYQRTLTKLGLPIESCYIDANVVEIWHRMSHEAIEDHVHVLAGRWEDTWKTEYRGEFIVTPLNYHL